MENNSIEEQNAQVPCYGAEPNIIHEYTSLRSEIASNDTSSMQLFTASLIIIAASMGFAFQGVTSPLLRIGSFCAVTGIISIIIWQMIDRIKMTFIIAAYLRVFIEPELKGINWETRLHKFRKDSWMVADKRQNNLLTIYQYVGLLNLVLAIGYYVKSFEMLRGIYFPDKENALISISEVCIAPAFIVIAACLFFYTWNDASKKLKQYIDNNEEYIEKEWRKIL